MIAHYRYNPLLGSQNDKDAVKVIIDRIEEYLHDKNIRAWFNWQRVQAFHVKVSYGDIN